MLYTLLPAGKIMYITALYMLNISVVVFFFFNIQIYLLWIAPSYWCLDNLPSSYYLNGFHCLPLAGMFPQIFQIGWHREGKKQKRCCPLEIYYLKRKKEIEWREHWAWFSGSCESLCPHKNGILLYFYYEHLFNRWWKLMRLTANLCNDREKM